MSTAVSVIIPTFNRAPVLERAVRSVLTQTHPAAEIIVVDDGSTDDTAECINHMNAPLRYIRQSNRGVSAARNTGIDSSFHDWIAFLDSDDEWRPQKLELQLLAANSTHRPRLVHCDETWLRQGKPLAQKKYHAKRGGDLFKDCLARCVISPSAALVHQSLLDCVGHFDESLPAAEDYDLWLRICARESVAFVPESLVIKYGGHNDQLSRTTAVIDQYRITALVKLLRGNALRETQKMMTRAMLQKKYDIVLAGALKHGNSALADQLKKLCADTLNA